MSPSCKGYSMAKAKMAKPPDPKPAEGGEDFPGMSRQVLGSDDGTAPQLPPMLAHFDPQLTNMVIDEQTCAEITHVLHQLVRDTHASSGMVLDRPGQIIVFEGESYKADQMNLGALVAGTYGSTRQMARILGEANFRTLVQEGAREKIFTESVGDHWLVSIIFDRHTHLGLVKMLSSRATVELGEILVRAIERSRARPKFRDQRLLRVTNDTIDLIFRDDGEK
jgi:predicted regulator of Ras-like GTPase activity (Roadblock/LC7/MglB family)